MAAFSLGPHMVSSLCVLRWSRREGERKEEQRKRENENVSMHNFWCLFLLQEHQSYQIRAFLLWPHLTVITSLAPNTSKSHWELGLQCMNLGGHNSVHNRFHLSPTIYLCDNRYHFHHLVKCNNNIQFLEWSWQLNERTLSKGSAQCLPHRKH